MKKLLLVGLGLLVAAVGYYAYTYPGDVSVSYDPPHNGQYRALQQNLQTWGFLDSLAEKLNAEMWWPQSLFIHTQECRQANAFYDPASHSLRLCYELIVLQQEQFVSAGLSGKNLDEALGNTIAFVLYHELGHAFIHILNLPATGREEDAADQLATMILLNMGPSGRDAALDGARWFWLGGTQPYATTPFWDTHSLDQQRYYNLLCWIYGYDPVAHAALLSPQWGLPPPRAHGCPAEYAQLKASWERLLAPYMVSAPTPSN